jgi:hypothetical protein
MDRPSSPSSDDIVSCTATEWTTIARPTTGAFAAEFKDAERKLRARHTDSNAVDWQTEFRIKGDVAITRDPNGLHFIPNDNARLLSGILLWKVKVMLMDAPTVKSEAGFTWSDTGIVSLNGDV